MSSSQPSKPTDSAASDGLRHCDVFIVGGGINGAGIARDAAGRGYRVSLCDSGDFGSGTSSASTKLIHGGLRYLEHYKFRLVAESLRERERLWQAAPHIIWPMRFLLPHHKALRPRWLLRLGLFIYDHLGGRKLLPKARRVDLRLDPAGQVLQPRFDTGFEYSDCWVEDSRLVVLNLRDACHRGAKRHATHEVDQRHLRRGSVATDFGESSHWRRVRSKCLDLGECGGTMGRRSAAHRTWSQ